MDSILIWLYLVASVLVVFAALARGHSGGVAFGFLVLCAIGTPVIAYAFLMALPFTPKAPEQRERILGD